MHVNIYAYCCFPMEEKCRAEMLGRVCGWWGGELMMGQPAALRICNKPDWHTRTSGSSLDKHLSTLTVPLVEHPAPSERGAHACEFSA